MTKFPLADAYQSHIYMHLLEITFCFTGNTKKHVHKPDAQSISKTPLSNTATQLSSPRSLIPNISSNFTRTPSTPKSRATPIPLLFIKVPTTPPQRFVPKATTIMGLTTHHNTVTSTSLPLKVPNTGALLLKNQNVKTLHAVLPHLTSKVGPEYSTTVLNLFPFHTTEISTAPTDQNKNASEHTTAKRPMYSKVPNLGHSTGKDKNKGDIGTSRTNNGDMTILLSTRKYWFLTSTAGSAKVRNDNYQAKFRIKDLTSTAKGATNRKSVFCQQPKIR